MKEKCGGTGCNSHMRFFATVFQAVWRLSGAPTNCSSSITSAVVGRPLPFHYQSTQRIKQASKQLQQTRPGTIRIIRTPLVEFISHQSSQAYQVSPVRAGVRRRREIGLSRASSTLHDASTKEIWAAASTVGARR